MVDPACTSTVDAALLSVAQRVYAQAAGGRNVVSVEHRFARSRALGSAVARGDSAATRRALAPLLKAQVKRLVVMRGTHVLARKGHTAALAPFSGTIRDASGAPVGRYRVSVAGDAGLAGIIHTLTGAGVTMTAGGRPVARVAGTATPAAVRTFTGTAFPQGALRVRLALPAATAGAVRADRGPDPRAGHRRRRRAPLPGRGDRARHAAGPAPRRPRREGPARRRATPTRRALRAEIVHLFRDRTLHVVRIRAVTAAGKLVNDVGGPYALAPASTPLHLARPPHRPRDAVDPGRHGLHQAHAPLHRGGRRAAHRHRPRAGEQPAGAGPGLLAHRPSTLRRSPAGRLRITELVPQTG